MVLRPQPRHTEQSRVFLKASIRKSHFFNITFAKTSPVLSPGWPRAACGALSRADLTPGARAQTSPQHGLQVGVPPLLPLQRALIQGSEDGLVKSLRGQLLGKLRKKNRTASVTSLTHWQTGHKPGA